MDEMKLKITNPILTKTIALAIKKAIKKSTGVEADVNLSRLSLEKVNGRIYVGIDGGIDETGLVELIKKV